MSVAVELRLGRYTDAVAARLAAWGEQDVLERIWAHDHTVWMPEPVPELTNRLGWLDLPERLTQITPDLEEFASQLRADGIAHVVVLGMGGSSLAPDVFAHTFGSAPGAPELQVLDSTHPAAVARLDSELELADTIFIVASKSGTTIEPLSFMEYFWHRLEGTASRPGDHFVATTDPGSKLEHLARERGFRNVFLAPPEVGGRYSALTEFGMVPAAAIGVDLSALQSAAMAAQQAHSPGAMVATAPGCRLGAALGVLAEHGRDKATFVTSSDLAALPAWIEQLIAESTGKDGKGIVPIGGELSAVADTYGPDRFFVSIATSGSPVGAGQFGDHPYAEIVIDELGDVGAVMYILEMATALAGKVLGIQPFDQPDVQLAKELARDAMAGELDTSGVEQLDATSPALPAAVADWLAGAEAGDYVGIHAFLEPSASNREILEAAQSALRNGTRMPITLDFGPRFLHSTGQLHKGGPNNGLFIEIIDDPAPHVDVPTTDYDFGKLIAGQALGDHLALKQRERRVLLVNLGDGGEDALQRVAAALRGAVE